MLNFVQFPQQLLGYYFYFRQLKLHDHFQRFKGHRIYILHAFFPYEPLSLRDQKGKDTITHCSELDHPQ